MDNGTNRRKLAYPLVWSNNLFPMDSFAEGECQKQGITIATELPCLDVALNGGIDKGLYVILASEQKAKLAFVTQLAEAMVNQDYGVLFATPEKNIANLTPFIISRQSLKFDLSNEQPINQILPILTPIWENLSKKVQDKVKLLTKNIGVIDSKDLTTDVLKARIKALFCNHDKFVCFVDCTVQNQNEFLNFLQEYRKLADELEIPIVIFEKVSVGENQDVSKIGSLMDKMSPLVDFSMFLKRKSEKGNVVPVVEAKDECDWLLFECHVMPSYLAPETRKCYLTFYSKFGLFSEA